MKQIISTLLFLYLGFNNIDCHQSNYRDDDLCPLWHFFNKTTNSCECYTNPSINDIVKCTELQRIELRVGYCMTYDEPERTIYIGSCAFNGGNFSTTGNGRFIELPVKNASELNDNMCGPMNRKGRLCSECIEGFGLSISSLMSVCSNCTGAWYGVPLYLFLEFIPITVFYIIILLLRVNLTSAPMVAFVFFSQTIIAGFQNFGDHVIFEQTTAYNWILTVLTLYAFWNLDIFRYIFPPFCVSPELKHIHVVLIYYVSAFY